MGSELLELTATGGCGSRQNCQNQGKITQNHKQKVWKLILNGLDRDIPSNITNTTVVAAARGMRGMDQ